MKNPTFIQHAVIIMDMFDCAIGFLGPDLDPLVAELVELGERHQRYGIPQDYLHYMSDALMYTMDEIMGKQLTQRERASWQTILDFLVYHMSQGYH
jgi:hemoglobin-like flavoprotein